MRRLLFLPLIVFIGCVTPSTDNSPDATISENLDATASGGFDSLTYCKAWCQHAVDTSEVVDVTADQESEILQQVLLQCFQECQAQYGTK